MKELQARRLVRNFAIEVLVYTVLVAAYFFLILRYLAEPLAGLYDNNLIVYAFLALGLIVIQGIFLDFVTSFLIDRLGLDRLE